MKLSKPSSQPQRPQRTARKLDRKKVQELARQGMSTGDIAKHQGVNRSTVFRYLDSLNVNTRQLKQFQARRADVLMQVQAKSTAVQDLVLDRLRADLEDEDVVKALTPTAKIQYLNAATMTGGVAYDKERLERGQSTENVGVLVKILAGAQKGAV